MTGARWPVRVCRRRDERRDGETGSRKETDDEQPEGHGSNGHIPIVGDSADDQHVRLGQFALLARLCERGGGAADPCRNEK